MRNESDRNGHKDESNVSGATANANGIGLTAAEIVEIAEEKGGQEGGAYPCDTGSAGHSAPYQICREIRVSKRGR